MNIDIKHIAKLARLRIEDDQLDKFESEMENIVGMVEKLPDIQDEMTLDPDNPMILRKDVAVQDNKECYNWNFLKEMPATCQK